jgi:hypothetical protein
LRFRSGEPLEGVRFIGGAIRRWVASMLREATVI